MTLHFACALIFVNFVISVLLRLPGGTRRVDEKRPRLEHPIKYPT